MITGQIQSVRVQNQQQKKKGVGGGGGVKQEREDFPMVLCKL